MHFSKLTTLVVAALSSSALAVPAGVEHVVHERRDVAPNRWIKGAKLDASMTLPVRIGMKQSNLDKGDELLMEISDPSSAKFGQHYTAEEIVELFAPSQETVDAIHEWLQSAGVEAHRLSVSANKQWMQFDAAVDEAERIFKTKYHGWQHSVSGEHTVACDEYHVPAYIRDHIDYVTPGLRLMSSSMGNKLKKAKRGVDNTMSRTGKPVPFAGIDAASSSLSNCSNVITPNCITAMYNITTFKKAQPGNALGIFEEGDSYANSDLEQFFEKAAPQIPKSTRPITDSIDGGVAPVKPEEVEGEADLDFQLAYPIMYPQNIVLFQVDDPSWSSLSGNGKYGFGNTFLDGIDGSYCSYAAFGETGDSSIDPKYPDHMAKGDYNGTRQCGVFKPTSVISFSYGVDEPDLPTTYQQRQCSEFMKLAMQGVSVIIASGDDGVAGDKPHDGNENGCLVDGNVFTPDYPASCPYVTSAGATVLVGSATSDDETAVSIENGGFPSGGGFSNVFAMPSYQKNAVDQYFKTTGLKYPYYNTSAMNSPTNKTTKGGYYNRAGRAYPDIAAVGTNIYTITDGEELLNGGTSASTPVFAAIIARINEERLAAGKKAIGFLNPTLYANPSALHDIVKGDNKACGANENLGFEASKGWDPVTGLGTPNYPALLKVFMALP